LAALKIPTCRSFFLTASKTLKKKHVGSIRESRTFDSRMAADVEVNPPSSLATSVYAPPQATHHW